MPEDNYRSHGEQVRKEKKSYSQTKAYQWTLGFMGGTQRHGQIQLKHGAPTILSARTICKKMGMMKTKVPAEQWGCCTCFCFGFDPHCLIVREVKLATSTTAGREEGGNGRDRRMS